MNPDNSSINIDNSPVKASARYLRTIFQPGDVIELRIIKHKNDTTAGYFDYDHIELLAGAALKQSGKVPGVYTTINPCKEALLARANNRIIERAETLTSDKDIKVRHILPVDIDAERPAGISSTDAEHRAAIERAFKVREYLELSGIPHNSIVIIDSGNGAHADIVIDLPNNDGSTAICKKILQLLALKFDDDIVHVDQATFNASRVLKLPGTIAGKGDSTKDRPHRESKILELPDKVEPASADILKTIAAGIPEPPKQTYRGNGKAIEFTSWAGEHGVSVRKVKEFGEYTAYYVDDPFDASHNNDSPAVLQFKNGALAFKCFHSSCSSKTWKEYRKHYEPEAYERKQAYQPPPYRPGEPTEPGRGALYHLTDLGNAERLIDRHGADLRFCYSRKMWLCWNGKFWEWVEDGRVISLAAETIRNLYRLAADVQDKDERSELINHARRSESEGRLSAMVNLAQSLPGVAISIDQLDNNEYLLNFANGTVDLRTGQLRSHSRNDYITAYISKDYEADAKSELFESILDTIFESQTGVREFVQRGLGYSCTASQNEQVAFFPYSLGGSGKSTLLGAVCDALGSDYATEIEPQVFMVKLHEQGGPNEGVARLYRKRLAVSTEIEDGQKLSVSLVKRMTGGEKLHHEKKFEHGFEFTPTHKLWLSGNHKPVITDTTLSIKRRVKLINFPAVIPEDRRDKKLRDKLRAPEHQKAILAWLVEGAVKWYKDGLGEPSEVTQATTAYLQDQDVVGTFLSECSEPGPLNAALQADVYKAFTQWCVESGNAMLTKKQLRDRFIEHGIEPAKAHGNAASWKGIKLNEYGVILVTTVIQKSQSSLVKGNTREIYPKSNNHDNQNNPPQAQNSIPETLNLPPCPQCGGENWHFDATNPETVLCDKNHVQDVN